MRLITRTHVLAALAGLAVLVLGMPVAQAAGMNGTPITPQVPVAGQRLCGVGSGIALSGSGNLTCTEPTTLPSGPAASQGGLAAPCQLANVRIEGVLTVECDRMKAASGNAAGGR